jgi:hypothetical protein
VGLDSYPVREAKIDTSSNGDNVIIAGVAGTIIRVYQLFLVMGGDADLTFKDGAAITFDGVLDMKAAGSIVLDFNELHWFETSVGNAFVVNLSAPVHIGGRCYYTQSTA